MKKISFSSRIPSGITVLSNNFIDEYMPEANGEYVKVYISLLRLYMDPSVTISFQDLIDRLNSSPRDIRRALNFWKKKGLLEPEYDSDKELIGLTFLEPGISSEVDSQTPSKTDQAVPVKQTEASGLKSSQAAQVSSEIGSASSKETVPEVRVTAAKRRELSANPEVEQILYIAQAYYGRPLNASETDMLLYFYDSMNFSVDLLDYLLDYCITNDHKNRSYIQKVGFEWAKAGIDTAEKARTQVEVFNRKRYSIMKAYGISGRNPAAEEQKYMDKWFYEYHFEPGIIIEAINRTMNQIHEPSFKYTDSILRSWVKSGVRSLSDVERLDKEHEARKKNSGTAGAVKPKAPVRTNNSFNNFEPREYDYAELEKKILESSKLD